jgi:hypothetical protein
MGDGRSCGKRGLLSASDPTRPEPSRADPSTSTSTGLRPEYEYDGFKAGMGRESRWEGIHFQALSIAAGDFPEFPEHDVAAHAPGDPSPAQRAIRTWA